MAGLGVTLSSAINNYLRHLIQTKTIVFTDGKPSKWVLKELKKSEEDIQKGRVFSVF